MYKLNELISKEVIKIYIKEILDKILDEYNNVVLKRPYDIKNCKLVKYNIRLEDKRPIKYKQFLKSIKKNNWIKGQIDEMLKNKIIEPSTNFYTFNIIIVGKKIE